MDEVKREQQSVREPGTNKFGKGNRTGGRPRNREATVDELRSGVLSHCHARRLKQVLDGLCAKSPVEYAKLAIGLIPKKDDSIVTRVVNMQFDTVNSIEEEPDEVLESTPGDVMDADA